MYIEKWKKKSKKLAIFAKIIFIYAFHQQLCRGVNNHKHSIMSCKNIIMTKSANLRYFYAHTQSRRAFPMIMNDYANFIVRKKNVLAKNFNVWTFGIEVM